MNRKEARENVFELLFEASFAKEPDRESILELAKECRDLQPDDYILKVFNGVLDNIDYLDSEINKFSTKWKTSRLPKTSLSALRIAIFEIENLEDVPTPIAINEAVELLKKYEGEDSAKYVNGVIGSLARKNEE